MDLKNLLNGVAVKEETSNNGALPEGKYDVMIEKISPKTSAAENKGLSFQLRVVGPTHINACIFDYIALTGSEKALSYSLPKLKKIGELLGSEDTDSWLGKKVLVRISVDKQDAERNIVWGYHASVADASTPNTSKPTFDSDSIPF